MTPGILQRLGQETLQFHEKGLATRRHRHLVITIGALHESVRLAGRTQRPCEAAYLTDGRERIHAPMDHQHARPHRVNSRHRGHLPERASIFAEPLPPDVGVREPLRILRQRQQIRHACEARRAGVPLRLTGRREQCGYWLPNASTAPVE
jgi:hypothetical protein